MNKIYKVIYSETRKAWVVVSELVTGHKKSCGKRAMRLALAAAVGAVTLVGAHSALAEDLDPVPIGNAENPVMLTVRLGRYHRQHDYRGHAVCGNEQCCVRRGIFRRRNNRHERRTSGRLLRWLWESHRPSNDAISSSNHVPHDCPWKGGLCLRRRLICLRRRFCCPRRKSPSIGQRFYSCGTRL